MSSVPAASEKKRTKGKNFTDKEVHILIDTIEKYIKVIENKRNRMNLFVQSMK